MIGKGGPNERYELARGMWEEIVDCAESANTHEQLQRTIDYFNAVYASLFADPAHDSLRTFRRTLWKNARLHIMQDPETGKLETLPISDDTPSLVESA